jgi:soluble lytic murein transglycosylase-like protein
MKSKRSILIMGLLLLGWLVSAMRTQNEVKIVYVPVEKIQHTVELDPITIKKQNIRRQLIDLYSIDDTQVDWWATQIAYASEAFNVPENIMMSVIAVESEFDIFATNASGAKGPAQVIRGVWGKQLGLNIDDPGQNIYAGAYVLDHYRKQCGNWECALKAYNVGIGNYKAGRKKDSQTRYLLKVQTELAMIDSHTVHHLN